MTDSTTRAVRLEGLPVELLLRSQEHLEELVRELQIIAIGLESGDTTDAPPARVARLMHDVLERYAAVRAANRQAAQRAAETGDASVTLEMELPVDAAQDIRRLLELLDEADRLCQEGALLTLASPPDVQDFRRRTAQQLLEQLDR